jgi:hypothetical protein
MGGRAEPPELLRRGACPERSERDARTDSGRYFHFHVSDGSMRARLAPLGLTVLVTSAAAGCTSWSRLNQSAPVPARGTVQIWSEGQELLLRDSRTVGDSLVGRAPYPDTTRTSVALSAIDSVRVQEADLGKILIVGTGVAMAVVYAFAKSLGGD